MKPGDILGVRSKFGTALLHYIGRHPVLGHAVYVYPKWFVNQQQAVDAIWPDGYVIFYPAQSAVLRQMVKILGNHPLPPDAEMPVRYRRCGYVDAKGKVHAWIIVDSDNSETMKRKLSKEDRKLPLGDIWNHAYLIDRICDGWRPEDEG